MKRIEIAFSVLFCVAALFLYFFLIPQIPIWSSDEGRYAEIAREMWHLRDFILPHFNYVDYLEKPVLAPALTALTFELFGDSALSSRLVPICSALFGLGLTYYFSCKLFSRRVAEFSAIVLLTTVGYVLVGRFAVIDMLMTALMSGAIFFLMRAYFEKVPNYYLVAYAFIGLSILTKGLIGVVLPGLIFLSFLIWQKDLKEIRSMRLVKGSFIVGIIVIPWFISISIQEPEFFRVFILEHHFTRFSTGGFGRIKPFWFFVPIFFATAFPWTLFLPAAIPAIGKVKNPQTKAKLRFLLIWICVVLVFFSLPKSKLPYYLLPLAMPAAMMAGYMFSKWCHPRDRSQINSKLMNGANLIFLIICFAGAVAVPVYFNYFEVDSQAAMVKPALEWGAGLLLVGGLLVAILNNKNKRFYVFITIAVMTYGILLLSFEGMRRISPVQSTFHEATLIKNERLLPSDVVAIYSSPDHFSDLPFHLKQRIVIVGNSRGTLARESKELEHLKENEDWFYDLDSFITKFNSNSNRIFLLSESNLFEDLVKAGIQGFKVISKNAGKTLIMSDGVTGKR